MTQLARQRSATWKWSVCGLLFLATLLNYMDRQTLAQTIPDITRQYQFSNEDFGELELGFGLAFALGSLITGWIADRVNVRWLYAIVLLGWSLAGAATAYATRIGESCLKAVELAFGAGGSPDLPADAATHTFWGLLACRVALGLFEAGQWPCALVVTQRILSNRDRTLGNSLLQSGASIGAILTPWLVYFMVTPEPDTWREPFRAIGLAGMAWIIPWLLIVRSADLSRSTAMPTAREPASPEPAEPGPRHTIDPIDRNLWLRRFVVLAIVVAAINMTWQFFRAWLPKFLREYHDYDSETVNGYITPGYYLSADIGCLLVGAIVKWLASRGWQVHTARVATFCGGALLASLGAVVALLPRGPLLITLLMLVGAGALGLFPNYYSFSQELSSRHMGKITGILSAITWSLTAVMHKLVGRSIDETGSYAVGIFCVSMLPLVAAAVLCLAWGRTTPDRFVPDKVIP